MENNQPSVQHRGAATTADSYRGIPIDAAAGVHEAVVRALAARGRAGGRVADLGAGRGALSLRLQDAGFDPTGFDLDPSDWSAPSVPVHACDLDAALDDVIAHGPFDAVCAVEVTEHLENPRGFLRGLVRHLRSTRGTLVLTVPNPLETFSALSLFRRGTFAWFSPAHYGGGGHISILPHWLIDEHLMHLGVRPEQIEWSYHTPWRHPRGAVRALYSGIVGARKVLTQGGTEHLEGQTAMVVVDFSTDHSEAP